MRIFSYIVARDFGFAPNPFHGACSLAACKPKIRKFADVGDYIVGLTPKSRGNKICYIMHVSEKLTFNEYWSSEEYQNKKPTFHGSKKNLFGDNIYYKNNENIWEQANSHHSYEDGSPIHKNIKTDTGSTDQVLLSSDFSYWGQDAIDLPGHLTALKVGRSHKCNFSDEFVQGFVIWYRNQNRGVISTPEKWKHKSTFR